MLYKQMLKLETILQNVGSPYMHEKQSTLVFFVDYCLLTFIHPAKTHIASCFVYDSRKLLLN